MTPPVNNKMNEQTYSTNVVLFLSYTLPLRNSKYWTNAIVLAEIVSDHYVEKFV